MGRGSKNKSGKTVQLHDLVDDFGTVEESSIALPSAPRAFFHDGVDEEEVPQMGPFIAYLKNLPFNATEDDLRKVFKEIKFSFYDSWNGMGKVEVSSRADLIEILKCSGELLYSRSIVVSLQDLSAPCSKELETLKNRVRGNKMRDEAPEPDFFAARFSEPAASSDPVNTNQRESRYPSDPSTRLTRGMPADESGEPIFARGSKFEISKDDYYGDSTDVFARRQTMDIPQRGAQILETTGNFKELPVPMRGSACAPSDGFIKPERSGRIEARGSRQSDNFQRSMPKTEGNIPIRGSKLNN